VSLVGNKMEYIDDIVKLSYFGIEDFQTHNHFVVFIVKGNDQCFKKKQVVAAVLRKNPDDILNLTTYSSSYFYFSKQINS
jgi:hypothetical protein